MSSHPIAAAPGTATARASRLGRRTALRGWTLSLPAVVAMIALAGVPVLTVVAGAFSTQGMDAVQIIVNNPSFARMIRNTVVWVLISPTGTMLVGYAAAIAINTKGVRLRGMWRSLLMIPWITPTVAAATAWKWIFSRDFGTLNGMLQTLGLIDEPISWLTDPYLVLPALALVQVWCTFPFVMLMVGSGLESISDDVREAAELDGANGWQTLRSIVLPALRDVTFILVLITTVWSLNSFVPVWVITQGGPAGASTILPIELYRAFQDGSTASVSVIALLQLLVSMTIAWFYVRQSNRS